MPSLSNRFYVTGGTLPSNASSYVMRQADADLFDGLMEGEYCYVLNTRQIGKSSLMVRTAQRLREEGVLVALLDLTAIGQNVTVDEWYEGLLSLLSDQLRCRTALETFWEENGHLGPMRRFMEAMQRVVLSTRPEPICLFVDEIDSVRSLPFSTDEFFAGIRECYNRRVQDPAFSRLTFCLLGVATPVDLIADPRISPFNIGKRIVLTDFTLHEASVLSFGLGKETNGKPILERVLYWTSGHPYLTQRLCSALAGCTTPLTVRQVDAECRELFLSKQAQETDDNLAFVRNRLLQSGLERTAALDVYRQILDGRRVSDDGTNPVHTTIRLSGIAAVRDGVLTVRNRIYAHVFDARWTLTNMPDAEVRRQRSAYRRGVIRSASVFGSLAAVITALLIFAVLSANRARSLDVRASRLLYIADMNLIQKEWEQGNSTHVQDLLNEMKDSPYRGFEWDYWNRLSHRCQYTLRLPISGAFPGWSALTFFPNGRDVAGLQSSGAFAVWNLDQGRKLYDGNTGATYGSFVACSPDSSKIYFPAGNDIQIRNAANGALLRMLVGHTGPVRDIVCLQDGVSVLTRSDDGSVKLWDVASGSCSRTLREPGSPIVYLAACNSRFVTCTNNGVLHIWDSSKLHSLYTLRTDFGREPLLPTRTHLAISHDGSKLIGRTGTDTLEQIEVKSGRVLLHVGMESDLVNVRYSMDDSRIYVADKRGVHIRDAASGTAQDEFHEHTSEITCLEVSRTGSYLADGSTDGTIKVWSIQHAMDPVTIKASSESLWALNFSARGGAVAVASSDGNAYAVSTQGDRSTLMLKGKGRKNVAVFSHDGSRIAVGGADGKVTVWDAHTGELLSTYSPHTAAINAMKFTQDDRFLITGSDDYSARIVDASSGKIIRILSGHKKPVEAVDVSHNSRFVATGSDDATMIIWELSTGRSVRTIRSIAEIWGVAFSPDGREIANATLANIGQVWDTDSGTLVSTLSGHARFVTGVAFSPDGKRLITGSTDRTARLWEPETGRELLTLHGHNGQVNGIAFSPDGNQVATSCADGNIRIWNARSVPIGAAPKEIR